MSANESRFERFANRIMCLVGITFVIVVWGFIIFFPVMVIRTEFFPPECKFHAGEFVDVIGGPYLNAGGQIQDGYLQKGLMPQWKYDVIVDGKKIVVEERHLELVKPPFVYSLEEYL